MPSPTSAKVVSLDDLLAFNDQIRSMADAGIPLEDGLVRFAADSQGGAGELAKDWGERLKSGSPLSELVGEESAGVPRLYRAVLAAGLRSGRLGAALEGMAVSGRRIAETRQIVGASLVYPLIVFLLANLLLCLFVLFALPTILEFHHDFELQQDAWYHISSRFSEVMGYVGIWPAILLLGGVAVWWIFSGRALAMQPAWTKWWFGWLPGMRALLANAERANFAEVLSLLVAQRVPLQEGLLLAGEASGDPELEEAAKEAAQRIARGELRGDPPAGLPPLLGWLILGGASESDLSGALAQAARRYRTQVTRQADWLRVFLPVMFTLVLGGGITVLYAAIALGPWFSMMHQMAAPPK